MKNLPRDLSTFATLITQNYVYVDKTEHIYNLYATGDRYHFLSRPRRFGKSLLISTLKEFFSGNKALFEKLWISNSDYDWQKYPVVHLDFAAIAQTTPHDLSISLNFHLDEIAHSYSLNLDECKLPEEKMVALVIKLAHFNKVVVLIDEYNYPLLSHLASYKLASEQEKVLKNFYGVLKSLDAQLRAIFITGVSKFSKSTIFSGINNLIDLGLSDKTATLLGFTDDEIKHYFHEHIADFAHAKKRTQASILADMKEHYDGYRFSQKKVTVHNPFGVLYYLKEQELRNYWYESGTPLVLVNLLNKQLMSLETIGKVEFEAETLDIFDMSNIPLITLLLQTGYLTIKDYDATTNKFTLDYPNPFIEQSFKKNVIEALAHSNAVTIEQTIYLCREAFITNNLEKLKEGLKNLFAYLKTPLSLESRDFFYIVFSFLFDLLDNNISSSITKQTDFLLLTLETDTHFYKGIINYKEPFTSQKSVLKKDHDVTTKNYIPFILTITQTPNGTRVDCKQL